MVPPPWVHTMALPAHEMGDEAWPAKLHKWKMRSWVQSPVPPREMEDEILGSIASASPWVQILLWLGIKFCASNIDGKALVRGLGFNPRCLPLGAYGNLPYPGNGR